MPNPTLLVSLRRKRSGGVIRQLHLTGVARKASSLDRCDVEKHLVGGRRDHMHGTIAYLHYGFGLRLPTGHRSPLRSHTYVTLRDDSFQSLYGFFIRSTANVARTVIVVVREQSADFSVALHACGPITLESLLIAIFLPAYKCSPLTTQVGEFLDLLLIDRLTALPCRLQFSLHLSDLLLEVRERGVCGLRRQRFTEIGIDVAAITAWIQPRDNTFAIGTNPYTDIERRSFRRLLQRLCSTRIGRGTPYQLLG